MVIRCMTQNIDLSCSTGHQSSGEYFECFKPSNINIFHSLLLNIPDDKRAIIYKKRMFDNATKTWSWCFYLLGNGTPTSIESKSRRSPRYSENGFGNNMTFKEWGKLSQEVKDSTFTCLISDSKWCSELDTKADTFVYNQYEKWQNSGVLVNSLSWSSNFLCGNINPNMSLGTTLTNDTPFFGIPLEQMRNWDDVFDYKIKPCFYNGGYHTYSRDFMFAMMAKVHGICAMDNMFTDSMLCYDIDNPLKKTTIGQRFSLFGYKENEYEDNPMFATYRDYIAFIENNKQDMVNRDTPGYITNANRYLHVADYQFSHTIDDSPTKGLVGDYDFNNPVETFIPCGNWYFDNIYVSGNYDECVEYVNTGKVPSDAQIHRINSDGSEDTTHHEEDNPTNENTDGSKRENQAENNPTVGGITCGAVNYYYMPEQQVKAFFDWFWNNTPALEDVINNYVTGIYNNLSEMITGLYYFPCSTDFLCASIGTGTIQIGRYSSGISATTITSLPKNQELAIIKIEPYFNSFLDYEGYTKIQLYLPYFGIVDLPTNTVMGTTITVLCAVDITSCTMSYIVKSGGAIVFETSVPFGLNLPISLSSSMEKATNTLNSVIGLGSSIATTAMIAKAEPVLGALSLANTVSSFHAPVPDITVKGNTTSFSGQWQPQRCALIIQRPITAVPTNYGSKIGFCLNKAYKLDTLTGFTRCENAQITFSEKTPLKSEQEEIYNLLEKGVIL